MAETKKITTAKTAETKTAASSKTAAPKAAAPKATAAKTATPKAAATKAAAPKTTETKTTKTATAKVAETKVEAKPVEAPKAAVKAASKVEKKPAGKLIKVTLVKSSSGRLVKQQRTLEALGLGKLHSSHVVPDNKATRGMIFVVKHLVSVEEVK